MKVSTKIIVTFSFLFIFLSAQVYPQAPNTLWSKTFDFADYEIATGLQITNEGEYVIVGNINQFPPSAENIFLLKTDSLGNEIWRKVFITNAPHKAYFINKTSDNGFIITGEKDSNATDLLLMKTDSNGNKVWEKLYKINGHSLIGYCVTQTIDGGYIITGQTKSPSFYKLFVLKVDSNGTTQWYKFLGDFDGEGNYIIQVSDSNYVVCGNMGGGLYVAKLNSVGVKLWEISDYTTSANCIQETTDGGLIICGSGDSQIEDSETYILKTNNMGSQQWENFLPGHTAIEVREVADGGFILFGNEPLPTLIRTNSYGEFLWSEIYDPNPNFEDYFCSLQVTRDQSYILCGYTTVLSDSTLDTWLLKTKPDTGVIIQVSNSTALPNRYLIHQNYPNPFNPTTTIKYQIPNLSFVTLKVYDVLGNEIERLVNEEKSIGSYEVEFNASSLPSGIYFYRLQAGSFIGTKKMVLTK